MYCIVELILHSFLYFPSFEVVFFFVLKVWQLANQLRYTFLNMRNFTSIVLGLSYSNCLMDLLSSQSIEGVNFSGFPMCITQMKGRKLHDHYSLQHLCSVLARRSTITFWLSGVLAFMHCTLYRFGMQIGISCVF